MLLWFYGVTRRHRLIWPGVAALAAALVAMLGAIVHAQTVPSEGLVVGDPPHQGPYPHIRCICRFNGQEYRLGQIVCISSPSGSTLSRCGLHLNNTSWVPLGVPCTTSALPMSRRIG